MKRHVIHIYRPVCGNVEIRTVDQCIDHASLYTLLSPLLEGDKPERVSVLWRGRPRDMFVGETSRLRDLPRNEAATAIYRAAYLAHSPTVHPELLPFIAGSAVMFEEIGRE